MFVELNVGVYGIITIISSLIYFGNIFIKNNLNMSTSSCLSSWCLTWFSIITFIYGTSKAMDSGVKAPQIMIMTYLLCCCTSLCSICVAMNG